jgi:general L-amino acid transport system permease protein
VLGFRQGEVRQFMFGRYPIDERWRVLLDGVMFVALLVPLLMPRVPRKG